MPHPYWPLFDLRIRTPRLEIRLPDDGELMTLARVAAAGVHEPGVMPFSTPWTEAPSPTLERQALQWWWGQRASWSSRAWMFTGAVFVDGAPIGVQDIGAADFTSLRTVHTGSWLGLPHQGRGLGKEMRAAVLHLAFAGLDATEAYSEAWEDNPASLGVSRALGYAVNGTRLALRQGKRTTQVLLRLTREAWEERRRDDIEIDGLDTCLDMFTPSD